MSYSSGLRHFKERRYPSPALCSGIADQKAVKMRKIYLWNAHIAVWISCHLNVSALEDKPRFLPNKLH